MSPYYIAEYGRGSPHILRYSSSIKPWNNAWVDDGGEYWKYARQTEFYEVLMTRLIVQNTTKNIEKAIDTH